jgi:uncharacterized protein with von Willebrand factor type A (vWA) domain
MDKNFAGFIQSCLAGAKESREKTSAEIYAAREGKPADALAPAGCGADGFRRAIRDILSHKTMRDLYGQDAGLAAELTREILGFVNRTAGKLLAGENPFAGEEELFRRFEQTHKSDFEEAWENTGPFLAGAYDAAVLDPEFYYAEFRTGNLGFESVKEHFLETWGKLIFRKKTNREIEFIDRQRRLFCEILYRRIERLKEAQEIFEPSAGELGRLWDMSKGRWQKIKLDVLRKYARLLKNDSSLRALADMLGRAKQDEKEYDFALTPAKQSFRKAVRTGKADLTGIRESDDLSSLLPSETALFAEDKTRTIFYKKFAEKKLQTFEYQNTEVRFREEQALNTRRTPKQAPKGPFIICVDTSGSMQGTPETVAKTLCFAILKIALRENRECFLVSFSDSVRTLRLADMKRIEKTIDFFSSSFYGGTDPVPAVEEALRMLETRNFRKADIVMVSDFVMPPLDGRTKQRVLLAKKNKTKFHSLVIGKSGNRNAIKDFDNNWIYDAQDPQNALRPEDSAAITRPEQEITRQGLPCNPQE